MGLTKVRFRDYFFGTGLGILVRTFVLTFFFGTLKEIWASGRWTELLSAKVLFFSSLFIFSFFIPKIIKRLRRDEPISNPMKLPAITLENARENRH